MPVKRFTRGTGLTKRSYVKISGAGPEEVDAAREMFERAAKSNFDKIMDACISVLARAKLPVDPLAYAPPEMASKRPAEQTPEWYALKCLQYLRVLDAMLERNDARGAAELAVNLGMLWQEAVFKFNWEADALRGQKVKKAASEGGRARSGDRDAKRALFRATVDRIIEAKPHIKSWSRISAIAATELGVSEKTIQRYVRNPLKS